MLLQKIDLHNFRGLADVTIQQMDEHINLFMGVNGAGKSSILDAISLLMTWYIRRMLSTNGRGMDIPLDDIRNGANDGCRIGLTLDNGTAWSLYRTKAKEKAEKSDLSQLNALLKRMWQRMDAERNAPLPVVVHYRVNRSVADVPLKIRHLDEAERTDAYKNTLEGTASFRDFFPWFRMQEDEENEHIREDRNYRDRGLECIREAMRRVFPEYSDMKVQRRPQALLLKKRGETFKLNQLSDGEKCYIAMVCDLTSRLVMANPEGCALDGNGIVLIDEVDLHLHPQWQREVLTKLRRTFSNCQFIVSTHSPIVAADGIGKLFMVSNGDVKSLPMLRGIDYSAILRDFMDTASQDLLVSALVSEYIAYMQHGMNEDADAVMAKLTEMIPDKSSPVYREIKEKLVNEVY